MQKMQQKPESQASVLERSAHWKCLRCGLSHEEFKCPAFGQQCNKCNKYSHYGKFCKNAYKKPPHSTRLIEHHTKVIDDYENNDENEMI